MYSAPVKYWIPLRSREASETSESSSASPVSLVDERLQHVPTQRLPARGDLHLALRDHVSHPVLVVAGPGQQLLTDGWHDRVWTAGEILGSGEQDRVEAVAALLVELGERRDDRLDPVGLDPEVFLDRSAEVAVDRAGGVAHEGRLAEAGVLAGRARGPQETGLAPPLQAAADHFQAELAGLLGEDQVGVALGFGAGADRLGGEGVLVEAEGLFHVGIGIGAHYFSLLVTCMTRRRPPR